MSHQTHYRSYRGRVFTCQMTQQTILFVFGGIIVLIIRIWPNSKDLLFSTALVRTAC